MNHPHFEDVGSRERTKKVYTVYSRRSPKEVHNILTDMKVSFSNYSSFSALLNIMV